MITTHEMTRHFAAPTYATQTSLEVSRSNGFRAVTTPL